MKYLLMMHTPRGGGEYEYVHWAPQDWAAHLDYWRGYEARLPNVLARADEVLNVAKLAGPLCITANSSHQDLV